MDRDIQFVDFGQRGCEIRLADNHDLGSVGIGRARHLIRLGIPDECCRWVLSGEDALLEALEDLRGRVVPVASEGG